MKNKKNNVIIETEKKDDFFINNAPEKIKLKKDGNFIVGTLNLALNPLKKRNELYYRNNPWYLIVDIVLLSLIAILAIFLFTNSRQEAVKRIETALSVDCDKVSAGSSLSFNLNYKANIDTNNTLLYVSLPENFIIDSIQPVNLFDAEKKVFNLGQLENGVSGKIKITGFIWGNINEQNKIAFNFKCATCGKNGVNSALLFHIDQEALSLNFDMGKKVYTNSEFDGKIKLKNNTNNNIKNIVLSLGQDIEIKTSTANLKNNEITIDSLDSEQELDLSFSAIVNKEDLVTIKPQINLAINDNDFSYNSKEIVLEVGQPDLILSMSANNKNISGGEKIKYTINYNNKGALAQDISVNFSSNNPNFSIKSLGAINLPEGFTLENNVLNISDLETNKSGQLQIEAVYDRQKISSNQEVSLKAEINYTALEQSLKHVFISTKNKVSSLVSASASAYYYGPYGDQMGVGPLPPAVDMTTRYWVFVDLGVAGNNLSNFSLSAELPENVYFSGNKRVLNGDLIYGEIGKRLVWEIPTVNNGDKYRADFELILTPGAKDLGKTLNLLEKIKVVAKDSFTGEDIVKILSNVDTDLKNDSLSSGKGKVVNLK